MIKGLEALKKSESFKEVLQVILLLPTVINSNNEQTVADFGRFKLHE
jgi:hypothetical protein